MARDRGMPGCAPTVALALSVWICGCTHIGPGTVTADRSEYSSAIADSWKQQTLLNVVKLRYFDLPVFVDVSSVVSGYSLQTGVTVGGTASSERAIQGNFVTASGQAVYTDRPTITYVPLTGEKFLRGLVTPIDPKNIFSMLQSGYAADFILSLTVESINGVNNRSTLGGRVREAHPDFVRAMELLRDVQSAGGVGLRIEEDKAKGKTGIVFFRRANLPPDVLEKAAEVRRLLRLSPNVENFTLIYSPVAGAEGELAVNSRSMLQILQAFASYVDVPPADATSRAAPPLSTDRPGAPRPVTIRSGTDKPTAAFAAVRYRGHWFWVDDADWQTKRALSAVIFFFTLAEGNDTERAPLLTIPAQ
jgi:hypothetical protein